MGKLTSSLIRGGVVLVGAALLAKLWASKRGGVDFERVIERMPENSPPKWLFHNITAIRENTDRILELLEGKDLLPGKQMPPGAAEPRVEKETPPPPPVFPPQA